MMNRRFQPWSVGLLAALLLLAASCVEAGKPPKDPPPPPPAFAGTIFFKYGDDICQIDSSGVSVTMPYATYRPLVNLDQSNQVVISNSDPVPSSGRYTEFGGRHLWLNEEHVLDADGYIVRETDEYGATRDRRELFLFTADRSGPTDRLPLLASLPNDEVSDLYCVGIVPYNSMASERRLCWSNDGLDTFISFFGTDRFESHPNDPNDPLNFSNWSYARYIYKFPLVWIVGIPHLNYQQMQRTPVDSASSLDWAPDGETVVYQNNGKVYTHRIGDPLPSEISSNGRVPAWSPDLDAATTGDQCRIAFTARYSNYYNDQITVNPDGSGSVTVAELRADVNTENCWEPVDGTSMVILQSAYQRKTWSWLHDIVVIPAAGGTPVNLAPSLDRSVYKHIIAWRHGLELP